VVCFTLNNQGIEGAYDIAAKATAQRSRLDPSGDFEVLPVPMRVRQAEIDKLEARQAYAKALFGRLRDRPDRYWGQVRVPDVSFYGYEEVLATFRDEPGQLDSVLAAFERITSHIAGEHLELVPPDQDERERVLKEFARTAPVPGPASQVRGQGLQIDLENAYARHLAARSLWAQWRSLLSPRQQALVWFDRVRGNLRFGRYSDFVAASLLRLALNWFTLLLACALGVRPEACRCVTGTQLRH
jgi:hypothetical protein